MKQEKSLIGNLSKTSGGTVTIDYDLCQNCDQCYNICPNAAIMPKDGKPTIMPHCVECGACVDNCPCGAITMD